MNAPSVAAILAEVEQSLTQALALLDAHGVGTAAAPYIDLGLSYVRDERIRADDASAARSMG